MVWKVQRRVPLRRVSAHVALRIFLGPRRGASLERGANHDHVVDHHGRRGRADRAVFRRRLIEVFIQIDDAVAPEGGIGQPGLRVEGHHMVAAGDHDDALLRTVGPVFDAPRDASRRHVAARALFESICPERLAGRAVNRRNRRARTCGGVEHSADHQRRRFEVVCGRGPKLSAFHRQATRRFLTLSLLI